MKTDCEHGGERFTRQRDIVDKNGRPLRLYDDGYRIYGIWIGDLPINGPKEPIPIMEYKYCNFPEMAYTVIDLLMKSES